MIPASLNPSNEQEVMLSARIVGEVIPYSCRSRGTLVFPSAEVRQIRAFLMRRRFLASPEFKRSKRESGRKGRRPFDCPHARHDSSQRCAEEGICMPNFESRIRIRMMTQLNKSTARTPHERPLSSCNNSFIPLSRPAVSFPYPAFAKLYILPV